MQVLVRHATQQLVKGQALFRDGLNNQLPSAELQLDRSVFAQAGLYGEGLRDPEGKAVYPTSGRVSSRAPLFLFWYLR